MGMKPSLSDSRVRVPGILKIKINTIKVQGHMIINQVSKIDQLMYLAEIQIEISIKHQKHQVRGPINKGRDLIQLRVQNGVSEQINEMDLMFLKIFQGVNLNFKKLKAGSYENKSALDQYYSKTTNGATMISRRNMDGHENVPGAGSYDPTFSNKKSMPKYKIGTSTRD